MSEPIPCQGDRTGRHAVGCSRFASYLVSRPQDPVTYLLSKPCLKWAMNRSDFDTYTATVKRVGGDPRCGCGQNGKQFREGCDIHVACDDECEALVDPSTYEEWRAARDHWRGHSFLSGCSHGC